VQALLKIVEGALVNVPVAKKAGSKCDSTVALDTSNILFICGGAFEGLDALVGSRLNKASVGFEATLKSAAQLDPGKFDGDALQKVDPGDLLAYGLIPEFVGRFPCLAVLSTLTEEVCTPRYLVSWFQDKDLHCLLGVYVGFEATLKSAAQLDPRKYDSGALQQVDPWDLLAYGLIRFVGRFACLAALSASTEDVCAPPFLPFVF
jgi:ATP-dependent protease Clp ATPase subunit